MIGAAVGLCRSPRRADRCLWDGLTTRSGQEWAVMSDRYGGPSDTVGAIAGLVKRGRADLREPIHVRRFALRDVSDTAALCHSGLAQTAEITFELFFPLQIEQTLLRECE